MHYNTAIRSYTSKRIEVCSVTCIVPSSAAMAEPTRPETISPHSTGPSSRVMDKATTRCYESFGIEALKSGVALQGQDHSGEAPGEKPPEWT